MTSDLEVMQPKSDSQSASFPVARLVGPGIFGTAFSFLAMLACAMGTMVYVLCRGSIADPDIWWHLNNARYLFTHHSLPNADWLSFTVAGHPWMNHEWLAEIPYYLGYRAWGLSGVHLVEFVVIELIFGAILVYSYRASGRFKAAVLATCFGALLGSVSFGPRTILFGYLEMMALLLILQRYRRKGAGGLWAIPLIFGLWVNTHGSWSLGLVLFGIIVAAGFPKGSWGRVDAEPWTPSQFRNLVVTAVCSVAALFVNPYGYKLVLYPFDLAFRQKLNIAHVAEWVPVNFHDTRGKLVIILLAILFAHAILHRARWTLTELALLAFAVYSGLTYIRFLFLVAIVVSPIIAKTLDFIPPYDAAIDKPLLNAVLMLLMVLGVIRYWPHERDLQVSVDNAYPTAALAYLHDHAAPAQLLNFYTWGGYLPWKEPSIKIFLDSRVDIFEYEGALKDYLDLLELNEPDRILAKYKVRSVIFPPGEPLTYVLRHDPGWKETYHDNVCVLFEKLEPDRSQPSGAQTSVQVPQRSSRIARGRVTTQGP